MSTPPIPTHPSCVQRTKMGLLSEARHFSLDTELGGFAPTSALTSGGSDKLNSKPHWTARPIPLCGSPKLGLTSDSSADRMVADHTLMPPLSYRATNAPRLPGSENADAPLGPPPLVAEVELARSFPITLARRSKQGWSRSLWSNGEGRSIAINQLHQSVACGNKLLLSGRASDACHLYADVLGACRALNLEPFTILFCNHSLHRDPILLSLEQRASAGTLSRLLLLLPESRLSLFRPADPRLPLYDDAVKGWLHAVGCIVRKAIVQGADDEAFAHAQAMQHILTLNTNLPADGGYTEHALGFYIAPNTDSIKLAEATRCERTFAFIANHDTACAKSYFLANVQQMDAALEQAGDSPFEEALTKCCRSARFLGKKTPSLLPGIAEKLARRLLVDAFGDKKGVAAVQHTLHLGCWEASEVGSHRDGNSFRCGLEINLERWPAEIGKWLSYCAQIGLEDKYITFPTAGDVQRLISFRLWTHARDFRCNYQEIQSYNSSSTTNFYDASPTERPLRLLQLSLTFEFAHLANWDTASAAFSPRGLQLIENAVLLERTRKSTFDYLDCLRVQRPTEGNFFTRLLLLNTIQDLMPDVIRRWIET